MASDSPAFFTEFYSIAFQLALLRFAQVWEVPNLSKTLKNWVTPSSEFKLERKRLLTILFSYP